MTTDPTRVRVFRNLTRRCYSVQMRLDGAWRTVAHATHIGLDAATFCVSEAGRQRVLRTGKKTVHAWVEGEPRRWSGDVRPAFMDDERVTDCLGWLPIAAPYRHDAEGNPVPTLGVLPARVRYNPKAGASFLASQREGVSYAVTAAGRVNMTPDSVTAEGCR